MAESKFDKQSLQKYIKEQLAKNPSLSEDDIKRAFYAKQYEELKKTVGDNIVNFFNPENEKPNLSNNQKNIKSAKEIEPKIDPENVRAYLNNPNKEIANNAKIIFDMMEKGQLDSKGNPTDFSGVRKILSGEAQRETPSAKARQTGAGAVSEFYKTSSTESKLKAENSKIQQNIDARNGGFTPPYPNLGFVPKKVTPAAEAALASATANKADEDVPLNPTAAFRVPVGSAPPVPGGSVRPVEKPPVSGTAAGTGTDGISKGKKTTPVPAPDKSKKKYSSDEIYSLLQGTYGPIDLTFKTNEELKALLKRATGADGIPGTKDDYNNTRFLNELQGTTWFQSTGQEVRQRVFYKNQYNELKKTLGPDQIKELEQNSEYARGLARTKQIIQDAAITLGAVLDTKNLETIAMDIYDYANENSEALVAAKIRNKITYKPGQILSGQAGVNLAALKTTAAANGVDLEKEFSDELQGWVQQLAQGESVEKFKQIIRSKAKLGLPERVSSLLDNGVNLNTIYDPYRKLMASTLEINPETITLNDPTLRMAIGDTSEMSLYNFQKTLKKDPRWQYSSNAHDEISNITQTVLKDFGFQG
jgi:hypothetical protein